MSILKDEQTKACFTFKVDGSKTQWMNIDDLVQTSFEDIYKGQRFQVFSIYGYIHVTHCLVCNFLALL